MRGLLRFLVRRGTPVVAWLSVHVGRRGAFMAFLTVLDALYAYSLASNLPGRPPDIVWAWFWAAATLNAASAIFTRKDRIQFGLSAGFKTTWALYQFQQWLNGLAPLGWVSTVVWSGFAAIVLLISSWPEQPLPLEPSPDAQPPPLNDITDISQVLTPPTGIPLLPPPPPSGAPEQKDG